MNKNVVPLPPELPANIDDWVRKIKAEPLLNDMTEEVHRVLVNDSSRYRALLRAVHDSHAEEGSLGADNFSAAELIRNKAKEDGSPLAGEKLATISKSLGVVLRRYGLSRKQRRQTVGGQVVPAADDNNGD